MNQEYEAKIKEKMLRLQEWQKSDEYLAKCTCFRAESEKMCRVGQDFLKSKAIHIDEIESSIVRTVIGSDSSLHRGVYCPSPIYDLVIGNTKRGKTMKRLSAKSKSYYLFGFDALNRLRQIKKFYNGCLASTEYLIYEENTIYGITLCSNGRLESVSTEKYEGSIESYHFTLIMQDNDKAVPLDLRSECYFYDDIGLSKATVYRYSSSLGWHSQREYLFEREADYLSAYRTFEFFDYFAELTSSQLQNLHVYKPLVTRLAKFNPYIE